jgi:hypothetical protein
MNDSPLELIPYGRTAEAHEKIERKKRAGQRGAKLFFLQIIALCLLVIALCLAWK